MKYVHLRHSEGGGEAGTSKQARARWTGLKRHVCANVPMAQGCAPQARDALSRPSVLSAEC